MHKKSGLNVTVDNEAKDKAAWTVRRRGSATHVRTHLHAARNARAHAFIRGHPEWTATLSGQTKGCSPLCACGSTGREVARRTQEGQGDRDKGEGEGARRAAQLSLFKLS